MSDRLKSFPQLFKAIRKWFIASVKYSKNELKKDGVENVLLHIVIKLVWFLLIFRLSLCMVSYVQKDNFYSTLLVTASNFLISYAAPTWFSKFVKGDFFDNATGSLLQSLLLLVSTIYAMLFVWPGYLAHDFKKVIESYEEH